MVSIDKISMVVDHRETNAKLLRALERHPAFHTQPGHLTTGDFKIGKVLLIERKTWPDFALSVIQGRLFRQAFRLAQATRNNIIKSPALIIEGPEEQIQTLNMSKEAIMGAITSLQLRFHIPVFRTKDPTETVKIIQIIYQQLEMEVKDPGHSFPTRHRKFNRRNRLQHQIFILQGLPGIGGSRARDLLDHFGGVGRVFAASETELRQVSGIGNDTARKIRKILEP